MKPRRLKKRNLGRQSVARNINRDYERPSKMKESGSYAKTKRGKQETFFKEKEKSWLAGCTLQKTEIKANSETISEIQWKRIHAEWIEYSYTMLIKESNIEEKKANVKMISNKNDTL